MSYIKLNGREFDADIAISAYNRNFNVLDGDNAGRVLSGLMIRDIIGTYLGHKITVFGAETTIKGWMTFGTISISTPLMILFYWRRLMARRPSATKPTTPVHLRTLRRWKTG